MTDQPTNPNLPAYPTPGGGDPFEVDTRTEEQRRPVPRFEIVHKPHVYAGVTGDEDDRPNPQPWHVRIIGANGEPLMSTETYVDERSAENAIVALASMFGLEQPRIMPENHDGEDALECLEGEVVLGLMQRTVSIPILRVES